jgi:macrolide-specific efflux system membrane fusion protein
VAFLGDGFGTVNVIGTDGKITETRIEIGLYNDSNVEVLSGLTAGAIVITGTAETGTTGFPGMGGTGGVVPGGIRPR